MSEISPLTLNFVAKHPQEAAGVLQQLAVEDTVAFMEKVPPELGSKLLDHFPPQYASQCILTLDSQISGTMIQGMKSASTISMFRIIPRVTINSLLNLLTIDKKSLLETQLAFPQNSVGAWIDSDNPPIPESTMVADLRRSIRSAGKVMEYAPCVVKADGTIAGLLSLSRLATAKEGSKVSKIMATVFRTLSVRDSLQSAAALPDWDLFNALPVTNRKGKYIGMLTQKHLMRGLSVSTGDGSTSPTDSILTECINAYASTLSWLVQTALSPSMDTISQPKHKVDHGR